MMSLSNPLFRKLLLCGCVFAGVFCTALPLRADLIIKVSEDGAVSGTKFAQFTLSGSPTSDLTLAESTVTLGPNATSHDFTVRVLGGDANQTTGPTQSELLSSTTSVTENGSGTHTVTITITGSGYTAPTAPPPITAFTSFSGNVNTVGTGTSGYLFSAKAGSNTIDTAAGPGAFTTAGAFTTPDSTTTITSLSSPYSIQQTLVLNMNTHNERINYSSQTLLTQTPAPGGIVLAVTCLPCLGIGVWLRRRKAKVAG